MRDVLLDSERIREMASLALGSDWNEERNALMKALRRKVEIIRGAVHSNRLEALEDIFSLIFTAKRYRKQIIEVSAPDAIGDLLHALEHNNLFETERGFLALSGAPAEVLADAACETMHFLNPERYCLASRWVWNPERGTGALRGVIIADRRPFNFEERQKVLWNVIAAMRDGGYR
ncbi:MAG: hypothetical protein QXP70_03185, partial [Methanomassiliicoccales archaeon]